jgi:hypothetical protein
MYMKHYYEFFYVKNRFNLIFEKKSKNLYF